MSECELQRSLLHLYANVDGFGPYAPELFAKFALSIDDLQVLEDLMTSQRDGLLVHAQLLRDKQRRMVVDALPASAMLAEACLISLLDSFHAREGAGDLAATMRSFGDHAGEACATAATRDLELIRFEALYASIALRPPSPSLSRAFAGVRCTYDAYAATSSLAWPESAAPYCYFLFQTRRDQVSVLIVSPRLADLLDLFERGLSRGEVLQTLKNESVRAAAAASIEKLVCAGAPIA